MSTFENDGCDFLASECRRAAGITGDVVLVHLSVLIPLRFQSIVRQDLHVMGTSN